MENNVQKVVLYQHDTSKAEVQSITKLKGQLLSKKIETAMKLKNYNRQQFAGIMGVQPSIITRWLSGGHNFTVETLFEIEEQLDVQLISIDRPAYKQMSYHMVVGSAPTQHLHTSFINELSGIMASNVMYCVGSRQNEESERYFNADVLQSLYK